MMTLLPQRRGTLRLTRVRATCPTFDRLEDRMLLYSTTGGLWTYPVRITYSIVPDGTSIGGTPSNLQRTLGALPNWQQQIEKAATAWEALAGNNPVEVPDNGAPLGPSGNP